LKATQKIAGLQSANKRLRVMVLDARAKLEKIKLRSKPSAKANDEDRAAS
jgi:hypothetical protein